VQDDGLSNIRNSLHRRSTALRVQDQSAPKVIETFPQPGIGYPQPQRVGLTFWQWCARVVPIVVAIASTSLLAYYFLSERHPTQLLGRSQPEEVQSQKSSNSEESEVARPEPDQQQAQIQTPPAPTEQPAPSPPPQSVPTDLGPRLPMPSDDVLLMLIMSSITALNQANATGNYSVLRDLGAPAFQNINNAEKLSQIFTDLRNRKLDLSPILLFQPKLFRKPEMNADGMIRITGFFPTSPERVNFELIFQPVQSRWRLFGIAVNTSPTPPPTNGGSPSAEKPKAADEAKPGADSEKKAEEREKPPSPAKKPKAKSTEKGASDKSSETDVDVRDRIDNPPPAPPPASDPPKRKIWNPFGN
jgi:hypothetical protein